MMDKKYGEPWVAEQDGIESNIRDSKGAAMCEGAHCAEIFVHHSDRIAACINAMDGIDDPVAFVRAVKETCERYTEKDSCVYTPFMQLKMLQGEL